MTDTGHERTLIGHTRAVDSETLRAALREHGGAASLACDGAIGDGAVIEHETDAVDTQSLLTIYRRRARHVRDKGTATLAFDQAVADIQNTEAVSLLVCGVGVAEPPYFFAVFLQPEADRVVACLGIDQRR